MSKVPKIDKEDKDRLKTVLEHPENKEILLALTEVVECNRMILDDLMFASGQALFEMILHMSAESVAGPKHRGKSGGSIHWHGSQGGAVLLGDRKMRVTKPRLRHRQGGEVTIPAYQAMQQGDIGQRMLDIMLHRVSTRHYAQVLPEMAETVGISKSSVSRHAIAASEEKLLAFCERRWDQKDIPVVFIDGVVVGHYHIIVALGIDHQGHKHILGLREGATENTQVVKDLLVDLVERGLHPQRRRLFVIDGSKALRSAIDQVFGTDIHVQRCQEHKKRNVLGYLPAEQQEKTRFVFNQAIRLDAGKGLQTLRDHADSLAKKYPSAAASLREGLEELFTVHRLGLPPQLQRSLRTTNIIENSNNGMRQRTANVKNWQDGKMVLRWMASAYLETEKHFHRLRGHKHLNVLLAALDVDQQKDFDNAQQSA